MNRFLYKNNPIYQNRQLYFRKLYFPQKSTSFSFVTRLYTKFSFKKLYFPHDTKKYYILKLKSQLNLKKRVNKFYLSANATFCCVRSLIHVYSGTGFPVALHLIENDCPSIASIPVGNGSTFGIICTSTRIFLSDNSPVTITAARHV